MIYRPLGQTGFDVSVIGFGASPLGNVFGMVTREEGDAAVASAIDSGINFFDVSPYYGLTVAEQRLGEALEGRRDEVILATKCGRYGADMFDFSAATVEREFEASLRRLKTDHVDLLQAHDVEFGSIELILEETLPAMRRLQQAGKARRIGITGYWPGLLAAMAERVEVDTVLNYCHSNLLMGDMAEELTPLARRKGIGLINASPLHMGLLGGRAVPEWHPAPAEVRAAAQQICERCEAYGLRPATVALHGCLQDQAVASTLVGISSRKDLEEALEALQAAIPAALFKEIRDIALPVSRLSWPSGLAENQPGTRKQQT